MSSDSSSISPNNSTTVSLNSSVKTMNNGLKTRVKKYFRHLKPAILNTTLTFVFFLVLLLITRSLGLSFGLAVIAYFLFSFLLQYLQKTTLAEKLHLSLIGRQNNLPTVLETNSNKVLLLAQNRKIIAISLVKLEWPSNYISINSLLTFFLDEGIQVLDCREGCYLVFRKTAEMKRTTDTKEQLLKLIKEIEKTILFTRKKIELEYDFIQQTLVKEKEKINTILGLGLSPERFNQREEMSEEDFDTIRKSSLQLVSD